MAKRLGTERGMDRLIFFTDAVTAIAITLLVLPLVDLVPEFAASSKKGEGAEQIGNFLYDNLGQIFSFVLSFVIIARFWISNHGLLEHAKRSTPTLMWLNIVWAFTIVILPLPTEITAAFKTSVLSLALYIGTMAANSLLLTAIAWEIYRNPQIEDKDELESITEVWGTGITSILFIVALALALLIPHVTYWGLTLLLITGPLDRIVKPRILRWEKARRAANAAN
jgi:uncharacterized membrane protein